MRRSRARVDFDITCQEQKNKEDLAGDVIGDFKLTRRHDGRVEKEEGWNFVQGLRD